MDLIVDSHHELYLDFDDYLYGKYSEDSSDISLRYPKFVKQFMKTEFNITIKCFEDESRMFATYMFMSEDDLLKFMMMKE